MLLQVVCNLIEPILHSKYPAITLEEQAISIPLQILCLAIFDSILVHMLNTVRLPPPFRASESAHDMSAARCAPWRVHANLFRVFLCHGALFLLLLVELSVQITFLLLFVLIGDHAHVVLGVSLLWCIISAPSCRAECADRKSKIVELLGERATCCSGCFSALVCSFQFIWSARDRFRQRLGAHAQVWGSYPIHSARLFMDGHTLVV